MPKDYAPDTPAPASPRPRRVRIWPLVGTALLVAFLIGGSFAGAAGLLAGLTYPRIQPYMGILPGLKAFIAAVLGGIGNGLLEVGDPGAGWLTSFLEAGGLVGVNGLPGRTPGAFRIADPVQDPGFQRGEGHPQRPR